MTYIMEHIDYTDPATQETIKEQLRAKTLRISFTKVNGDRRDMLCTLSESAIPADKAPKTTRSVSSASQPVFDITQGDWRSFRWDSIIEVTEP